MTARPTEQESAIAWRAYASAVIAGLIENCKTGGDTPEEIDRICETAKSVANRMVNHEIDSVYGPNPDPTPIRGVSQGDGVIELAGRPSQMEGGIEMGTTTE